MLKQKHVPIRTCVACRETDEKRDLLRIVRHPDGSVSYDAKGKLSGRGAYVCARASCIALARKQKKLERSLKVSAVPVTLFEELNAQAASNPSPETTPSPETRPGQSPAEPIDDSTVQSPIAPIGEQPTTTTEPPAAANSESAST